jgi:prepilin-type N-terminal cleavage/methylation domain-containing protein
MRLRTNTAFTLVEILIVVVILGTLAAIAVMGFAGATSDAQASATASELQKIRRHIGVYQARNVQHLPSVTPGDGTWGEIIGRDYLLSPPTNAWVGGANSRVIVFGSSPDTVYQSNYGWIYNPVTGDVYAGGFDSHDQPLPR